MAGVEASEIRLGVAVFGRVSGFPWWPAVVSKCEPSGEWRKDGKFWVRFFNDPNGSWLKSSEIRSFDDYNKDRCLEHNSKVPKFRRYSDRIVKACSLAEKYISSPKRIRIRVLGPRGTDGIPIGDEQEVISINDEDAHAEDEDSDPSGLTDEPPKKKYSRSSRSNGKRKRGHASSSENSDDEEKVQGGSRRGSKNTDGEKRTKRKPVRSLRYVEYMSPMEDRNVQRRSKSSNGINGKHNHSGHDFGLLHYSPPVGLQGEAERHRRLPKSQNSSEKPSINGANHRSGLPRRSSMRSSKTDPERSSERQRSNAQTSRRERPSQMATEDLDPALIKEPHEATERYRVHNPADHNLRHPVMAKALSTRVKNERRMDETRRSVGRRSVRSRADGSFVVQTPDVEETDSEEDAERVRKVVNGSLEAVAEDLVEHAVRHKESPSRIWKGNHGLEGNSVSLGGSDLLCSILNRVSDLERDVALLQKKATTEENATLGEDASAAGLKSAVEALASATSVFAKVREYDSLAISRSLDLLWADGHFPLQGADGELLRTVARSLVLASCRRRQAEGSHEAAPTVRMGPIKSFNEKNCEDAPQLERIEGQAVHAVQQKSNGGINSTDDAMLPLLRNAVPSENKMS